LKVLNRDARPHRYDLHNEGIPGLDLSTDGLIEAEAGAVVEISVHLMTEESRPESRSTPVTFVLIAADDDRLSVRGPLPRPAAMSPPRSPPNPSTAWYREPYVWLLISIPAAAVLAGLITLALALASDDVAPAQGAKSSHETG